MKSILAVRQQLHSVLQINITTLRLIAIAAASVLGASLSFVVQAQSKPTKQVAPDALVASLYRQAPDRVFQARSRALLDKYFEKSLADLTWMELLHWESSGTSELEDFDYVLYNFGYGEGTITKPLIGKPSYDGRKAQVNVSYNVVYAPPAVSKKSVHNETIIFLLAAGETGWKITDIKYDCRFDWCVQGGKMSLFEMYSMDSKATAAEREYWEQSRGTAQGYKDYLQKYPNGAYASVARAKIK